MMIVAVVMKAFVLANILPSTANIHSAVIKTLADVWWFRVIRLNGVNVPAITM
jgi:hypothetical protein